jgi:hypothetical protein
MVRLKYCTVERHDLLTLTTFLDGAVCEAVAPDTDWHRQIWGWVGCEGDGGRYNFEHEFIHSFIAEAMWDEPSYVVWMAAHKRKMSVVGAKFEERWCYHFHRYLNDIGPAIEPEWPEWKERAKALLP